MFTKYALSKAGWKVASLDSRKGFEYKGVVDLVAVKRNNRSPDELTVMLVQVKGGSARVSKDEIARLRRAAKRVRVPWNVARKPAESVRFKKSFGLTSFFWERETKDRRQKRPKNSPTGVT